MKIPLLLLLLLTGLCGCHRSRPVASLDTLSEQLSRQFRTQYEAGPHASPRQLTSVRVEGFELPNGVANPYLLIAMVWNDSTTHPSVPLVQLGDGLYGVTYVDHGPDEKGHAMLSAILTFR